MTQDQYDSLLKVPTDQLIDSFVKKYYEFYGTSKMEDIFFEVENCTKIQNYIESRSVDNTPNAVDILRLLKSIPYFFFSRAGSRCVAAFSILLSWEDRYNRRMRILDNEELTKLCAHIIALILSKTLLIDKKIFDNFFLEISTEEENLVGYQLA
jgi:hypothetical protein